MSNDSSEYTFPIFISSTHYDLVDLRAELASHLRELGYRPILSSSEGFPDNSPTSEPWESCLPVVENSFVTILIIDRKYGQVLDWPHFQELFQDRKISPTHAEYLYAHKRQKRLLVFIRNEILTHYQSYRIALKKANNDEKKAEEFLLNVLPAGIDFKIFPFIKEIKTSKTIPWITGFNDITDIKKEVQKKMLNELAEIFMIKERRLEVLIKGFEKALSELTPEKRQDVLIQIGYTRELVEKSEALSIKKDELEKTKKDLEFAKEKEKKTLEIKINSLNHEVTVLKGEIKKYANDSENYFVPIQKNKKRLPENFIIPILNKIENSHCDSCNIGANAFSNDTGRFIDLTICPTCKRELCDDCWYGNNSNTYRLPERRSEECWSCSKKKNNKLK